MKDFGKSVLTSLATWVVITSGWAIVDKIKTKKSIKENNEIYRKQMEDEA